MSTREPGGGTLTRRRRDTPEQTAAAPASRTVARPARHARRRRGAPWTPYLFVAPYLLLFVAFVVVPAVVGLWISLHDYDFLAERNPFVGLDNYTRLFDSGSFAAADFWQSMKATGLFTLYSVPPLVVAPLAVAVLLNRRFRGRTVFRALFFTPYVLGIAVIGVLFGFILDPNIGLLNDYLGRLGVDSKIPWTTSMPEAWVSLVAVTVWWTLGFNAVIYLAGLQEIPRDLYEAASVDGANTWQSFWHITLPGLRRVLVFVITITVLASANMFGQSYLITQGGPGAETRVAIMHIAAEGLGNFRMGSAAAMSYVLAAFLVALATAMFALFRRWED
jgi:multiple sugar transport system permease protein